MLPVWIVENHHLYENKHAKIIFLCIACAAAYTKKNLKENQKKRYFDM